VGGLGCKVDTGTKGDIGGPWWIGKGVDTGTRAGIGGPW